MGNKLLWFKRKCHLYSHLFSLSTFISTVQNINLLLCHSDHTYQTTIGLSRSIVWEKLWISPEASVKTSSSLELDEDKGWDWVWTDVPSVFSFGTLEVQCWVWAYMTTSIHVRICCQGAKSHHAKCQMNFYMEQI